MNADQPRSLRAARTERCFIGAVTLVPERVLGVVVADGSAVVVVVVVVAEVPELFAGVLLMALPVPDEFKLVVSVDVVDGGLFIMLPESAGRLVVLAGSVVVVPVVVPVVVVVVLVVPLVFGESVVV